MKIKLLDILKVPEGVRIPFFGHVIYEIVSRYERKFVKELPLHKLKLNREKRDKQIIVSVTSFPARINVVGYAIKSLFNQEVRPDRIILWLAEEQFRNVRLPQLLLDLCEIGLEIRFCEDLKSHKKYYYALKEQKGNELIITYDDDLIYPEDSIKKLYKTHLKFPTCIICNRAQECREKSGVLQPYETWRVNSKEGVKKPSARLFPSTGGGTLYPYESVSEEVYCIETMKNLAFTADDLWVRFMSAQKGTKIVKTRKNHKTFTVLEDSQNESLQVINCLKGQNNQVLERLSKHYSKALESILQKEG